MYYVYLLKSKRDSRLYIGSTSNLRRRFEEHKRGFNKSTKNRRPLKLLYCEIYLSKKDALIREARLKQFKNSYTELTKRLKYSLQDNI